jgi:hypothetical protein
MAANHPLEEPFVTKKSQKKTHPQQSGRDLKWMET